MFKRVTDIVLSLLALVILSPALLVIPIIIVIDSRGGIFYKQLRVGKDGVEFYLYKFRSMSTGSDQKGLITVGNNDSRITRVGYYLRKYKLDELPQLFNVVMGNMSLVGPRPEVKRYVNLYTNEQMKVLSVKPGLTDHASIEYFNESELLAQSQNPEKSYVEEIMPAKLEMNMKYVKDQSLFLDLKIMLKTAGKIIGRK